ncbi:MAG TPA: hypothetical protein VMH86_04700 [Rhizomicrobium sp.]|nr:hypothetical protein [Rhizomicrobium sp.]
MQIGVAWFPAIGGTAENQAMILRARRVLAAIAIDVAEASEAGKGHRNMNVVHRLIRDEYFYRGSVLGPLENHRITEVAGVARTFGHPPESPWWDPVRTVFETVAEWQAENVLRRWPTKWEQETARRDPSSSALILPLRDMRVVGRRFRR